MKTRFHEDSTKAASFLDNSVAISLFKQFLILVTIVEPEVFEVVKLKLKIFFYLPTNVNFYSFSEEVG